jgi:tRNA(Ile2) C34 agmatinyltransferase TiaS
MPRKRPPIDIYSVPVPSELSRESAECPACGGRADPIGFVVQRLVFKCKECGIRFKQVPDAERGGRY